MTMFKRALGPVITVVILVAGILIVRKLMAAKAQADPNQYRIAAVKTDLVKKTVSATGTLTAWTTVDIKSRAGGKVLSLPVDDGTVVKKGQLIAEIDPSDTLLTYNQGVADLNSSRAGVSGADKQLDLQQQQSIISVQNAEAALQAARAAALSHRATFDSTKSQADAQQSLTDADVASAKANLDAEEARYHQMIVATNPQSLASAKAALNQARANLKNAAADLKRQTSLLEKGYVSQSVVDQSQAIYDVDAANVESAQEKIDTIAPQLEADVNAEKAKVEQLQAAYQTTLANRVNVDLKRKAAASAWADYQQSLATVKQSEAALHQARADQINDVIKKMSVIQAQASVERAKASVTNASIQLRDTHVTAPADGIILKKYVEEGTLITSGISFNSTGTDIVQLGDISRMYVDVQVDETDVANVVMGQSVDITFDAYPTTPFEGKVIKIEPQAQVDSNVTTVHVRVEVDNSSITYRLLKPAMNATCEFIVDKKEDVVAVPNEAVKTDADGNSYVEVAEGGKEAPADKDTEADPNVLVGIRIRKQPIQVGLVGNDTTEVLSGLKEGDRVITQTIEPPTASSGNPFGGSKGPGRG